MTSELNAAFMRLSRRAERSEPDKLIDTFVDVGALFSLLSSHDHQILYGRRGTGKTHALHYLAGSVRREGDIAVYVDMRTIGSTGGIYADNSLPLTERGTRLLSDTLANVHDALMDAVLSASYEGTGDFGNALQRLENLDESIKDVEVVGELERESTSSTDGAATSLDVSRG